MPRPPAGQPRPPCAHIPRPAIVRRKPVYQPSYSWRGCSGARRRAKQMRQLSIGFRRMALTRQRVPPTKTRQPNHPDMARPTNRASQRNIPNDLRTSPQSSSTWAPRESDSFGPRQPNSKSKGRRSTVPTLLTAEEVAEACRVSLRTVRRWIADGDLPVHRLRRKVLVSEDDLVRFIKSCRT